MVIAVVSVCDVWNVVNMIVMLVVVVRLICTVNVFACSWFVEVSCLMRYVQLAEAYGMDGVYVVGYINVLWHRCLETKLYPILILITCTCSCALRMHSYDSYDQCHRERVRHAAMPRKLTLC